MSSTQQQRTSFQAYLLGPRPFSTFPKDLPNSLDLSNLEMFVDDSTAYVIGDSNDSISTHIQNVFQHLQN